MIVSPRLTVAQRVYLDFVRAAAALAVLFGHASAMFLKGGTLEKANIQVGAVPVFFLISGFLISLSVFQKHADKSYGFGAYFIDRFCRIYTAFVPALIFAAVIDWQVLTKSTYEWASHFNIQTWFGNLLMMQDFPLFQIARRLGVPDNKWFVGEFGSAGPFWTISIEWWIYMLFGYVVYYCLRREQPLQWWQSLVIGVLAIEPAYHFIGGPDRCLTMLWVLGMGGSFYILRLPAMAESWHMKEHIWRRTCFAICAASIFAMVAHAYANKFHQENPAIYPQINGGITEFQMGVYLACGLFALLLACGTYYHAPRWLEKTVSSIANYSYSLYLTHSTVLVFMLANYGDGTNGQILFWQSIALSNVIAILFWWLFERHHRVLATRMHIWIPRPTTLRVVDQTELT